MKKIWAIVLLSAVSGCSTPAGSSPLIQLRLAEYEGPVEAAEKATFNGQDLYLRPQVVISDQDIINVKAAFRGETVVLDVQLSAEGAERLRSTTAANLGHGMALMFGGEVVSVPTIRDQIGSGHYQMSIPVDSKEEGEEVMERINARWPAGG